MSTHVAALCVVLKRKRDLQEQERLFATQLYPKRCLKQAMLETSDAFPVEANSHKQEAWHES